MAHYLDAAATAQLLPQARAAMLDALDVGQANASSVHSFGHRARSIVDHARERIAARFGVRAADVIFTSGGTEANALAITGLALANPRGRHVVTTGVEHSSILKNCEFLERVFGFDLSVVPVDGFGYVDPAAVERVLRDDTTLVSVGLASGEVGTVQPVAEIARLARARGAIMHSDVVQAAASLPVTLSVGGWPGADVDAVSLASHKFGGPQGAGALIVRQHLAIEALIHGGGQERGVRSGTENVAAIAGFAAAVDTVSQGIGVRAQALLASRDALITRLRAAVPGLELSGHPSERLPGHVSVLVPGVSGESMLVALDAAGIAASSGSACAAGNDEPSPVLLAMQVDPALAQTALRLSFAEPLNDSIIERVAAVLSAEVRRARR